MQIFKSTKNTRPILPDSFKYIRSDAPTRVTAAEADWLFENRITTVIDLRTEDERAARPCPLMNDARFAYHPCPINGGDKIPNGPMEVPQSYIAMADGKFNELVELLLSLKTGALYFCTAGKDRTGVLSAAILHRLGFSREYIVEDYMKSKDNLLPTLTAIAAENPAIDLAAITPTPRYITEFLDWYTEAQAR